jgi:hypothetical protein
MSELPTPLDPSLAAATEPSQAAGETTALPSLDELIRSITEMEECLAKSRNRVRRRASSEPVSAAVAKALATLALEGEERARTTCKRYRSLEATLNHACPPFPLTRRFDWKHGGDAALKLALSCTHEGPMSLDEAIDILTPAELDSYSCVRRTVGDRRNLLNDACPRAGQRSVRESAANSGPARSTGDDLQQFLNTPNGRQALQAAEKLAKHTQHVGGSGMLAAAQSVLAADEYFAYKALIRRLSKVTRESADA